MNRMYRLLALCVVVAGVFVGGAAADELVLTNGQRLGGRVIGESEGAVEFEVRQDGAVMRTRFARSVVAKVERESEVGASYCALPVIGSIGPDGVSRSYVTAGAFRAALGQVRRIRPDYVVLVIDSPGGLSTEMEGIVRAIWEHKDELRFVAYVKKDALSAAAVIAMACRTIVMAPDGRIGAAVPWQVGPDGTPENIEEKFQSALRASFRVAAECGGHSPLLAAGMMDGRIELTVEEHGGKPVVVEVREETKKSGVEGRVIKSKGQILTLTGREAVGCGLAAGLADSMEEVRGVLGLGAWYEVDDVAWHTLIQVSRGEHPGHNEQVRRAQGAAARQELVARIRPQVEAIDSRLEEVRSKMEQLSGEVKSLMVLWEAQRDAAKVELRQALSEAHQTKHPRYMIEQAEVEYKRKLAKIQQQTEGKMGGMLRAWKELERESNQLLARREGLIKSLPEER